MPDWSSRFASNEIQWQSADQFLFNPDNPRQHPQVQRDAMRGSLDSLGWVAPVIVNKRTGYLVDGHERVWHGLDKEAQVPFIEIDLDPAEEKQFLLTFDYITYLATYDRDVMEKLMHAVQSDDANVQTLIASIAEEQGVVLFDEQSTSDDPGAQVDKADELREKWQTERGQLWVIPSAHGGEHRLLCGDSTVEADVARLMGGGERAHMIMADPPYGVDCKRGKFDGTPRKSNMPIMISGDHRKGADQRAFICDIFTISRNVIQPNAVVYMWSGALQPGAHSMFGLIDAGLHIQSQLIWNKSLLVLGRSDYQWKHEICWYGYWDGKNRVWNGGRDKTTVIDAKRLSATLHPNEKPPELYHGFIKNSSHATMTIYDPFGGSGTTMVACEQLGRQCRMMEIEPKYCAVILQRMADMGLEPRLESPS